MNITDKINFTKYFKYTRKSLYFAIPAILLGLIIDNIFTKLQDKYGSDIKVKLGRLEHLLFGFSQLIAIITIIYIIEKYINKQYITLLQDNTHALLFTSIYYGTHLNMINNFSKLLEF